jgi:hypothetical protein
MHTYIDRKRAVAHASSGEMYFTEERLILAQTECEMKARGGGGDLRFLQGLPFGTKINF